ncbi:YcxB family protein [Streptomyces capitiformicae]|uniref:YcxB-like protein domain-containing protein n=1 Tax=Streptomyces capitiformicae TaxID=2014920 RepID=A0A919L627_9ACTN|nr:YcxB family protein [Streptomyces capitiformicae]GHH84011.1 hypothetical protein GCM10017771_12210 [Streptomyces capitiformicae]
MAEADGEHVELVYRPTVGEFHEALTASARASSLGRWGRGLLLFSGGASAFVAVASLTFGSTVPATQVLVMAGTAVVGLVVLPWLQAHRLHRRAAERGLHRAVLDPWGVTTTTTRGPERMTRWSEIPRYEETRRTFVLLTTHAYPPTPIPLPKRGTRDVDGLRALLKRRLSS